MIPQIFFKNLRNPFYEKIISQICLKNLKNLFLRENDTTDFLEESEKKNFEKNIPQISLGNWRYIFLTFQIKYISLAVKNHSK